MKNYVPYIGSFNYLLSIFVPNTGLGICSSVFRANRSFLWAKKWRERIAHGHSFVLSDGSKSLKSLFKKEWKSEARHERFALGHKKGEQLSKTYEKHKFFEQIARFFASHSLESLANQSHRSFLKSQESDLGFDFVKSDMCQLLTVAF